MILEAKLVQVVPHGSYARWEVVMVWLQEFDSYRVHSIYSCEINHGCKQKPGDRHLESYGGQANSRQ